MSNRNVSRLDAGLIARKGEAVPAAHTAPLTEPARSREAVVGATAETVLAETVLPEPQGEVPPSHRPLPRGVQGTIAVTVRLDPARYERLKMFGVRRRRTNQEILVEAVDRYLDANAE